MKKNIIHNSLLCLCFFFGFLLKALPAQTTVVLSASKDNTLFEHISGALSNGSGSHFFVGNNNQNLIRRGLIAFDLTRSEIPAKAIVDSVELILHMSRSRGTTETIALHRVTSNWGEGASAATGNEGSGAPAQTGDATWMHAFFNDSLWDNPGGDFLDSLSASQTVGIEGVYSWGFSKRMATDVQFWLQHPTENDGWILIGGESGPGSAKRFDSRSHPMESNRPLLRVMFSMPTSVSENEPSPPVEFALQQNYPNPFNPNTTIVYSIPPGVGTTFVQLVIYNLQGQTVRTLVRENRLSGRHTIEWAGRNDAGAEVSSGIYFVRLTSAGTVLSRKMTLLR
ncbi:MAG: DNRLRE domain-containing protein [bacterium]